MRLSRQQLKKIIKEEKEKIEEMVGRRGGVPAQGLQPEDEIVVDEILELIMELVPNIGTPARALAQLRYYMNNMK